MAQRGDEGEIGPVVIPPAFPPPVGPRPVLQPEREGMHIRLSRVPGYTRKGLLKTPLLFQCPPIDSFGQQYEYDFTTYESIGRVQYIRPASNQLASIRFTTMYVDYDAMFTLYSGHAQTPTDFARELRAIHSNGTPMWLLAANPHYWRKPDVNMMVVIASLGIEERGGEVDTRYFDMSFTEFRTPVLARGGSRNDREKLPTYVTLDATLPLRERTLYGLAKTYYHASERWRVIAKANGLTSLPPSVDLVETFAGQSKKLRIPALSQVVG